MSRFVERCKPTCVWDLGANTGEFSRLSSEYASHVVSMDSDPACLEVNYGKSRGKAILPLAVDVTNPSPGIGWENRERSSLLEREKPDLILSLALIHHLAIANNLPLDMIAEFFSDKCRFLIVEFIPKEDKQVQRMLGSREDIFDCYNRENFELHFTRYFRVLESEKVEDSVRYLYLMEVLDAT